MTASLSRDAPARVRSFIALSLTPEALAACGRAREALRRAAERSRVPVRFLPDDALHVTLCFLGYVERDSLADFVRVLETNAAISPVSARFIALDAFSSAHRAHVVVAELADVDGRLGALADGVARGAEALGIPRETRAFRPHVTLARLKRPADVREWLARAELDPITTRFEEVRLYQSLSHPEGAHYSVLARAPFRGTPA